MPTCLQRTFPAVALFASVLIGWVSLAYAELTVFDAVSAQEAPVTLSVRTSKFFMADGGRRVEIFLDGQRRGRILTGADGYGFLRLEPQRPGMMKISAASGDSRAEGRLLVMGKMDRAVMVELEAAFMDLHLGSHDREECRRALESIGRHYRLIYIYRIIGIGLSRNRLEAADWPASVVLPWRGPATLEALRDKGVQVHALIGSAEVVAAGGHVEKRFSFEKSKNAVTVRQWAEIAKELKASENIECSGH